MVASLVWAGYNVYKKDKTSDKLEKEKYSKRALYGFIPCFIVGQGTFVFGEYKLRNIEEKVE